MAEFVELSPEDIAAFDRDGVIRLRRVFHPAWIELLAQGIERNLREPGRFFKDSTGAGSPGRYLTDMWTWFHIPEFRAFGFGSPAAAIAAQAMGAREVVLLEDNWFIKEGGATTRTPWHQDQPYYDIEGTFCSVWVPLDPVTTANGIEFVRGSHRWGRMFVPSTFRSSLPEGPEATFFGTRYEVMPDIEGHRADYDIVSWELEPGDCLVFSARTVHGAPGNPDTRRHRRMSTRWAAEDARFRHKGVEWSAVLDGHGLADGDPLPCAAFPVVWRRP